VVSYRYDLAGRLMSVSDTSAAIAAAVPPSGPSVQYATSAAYDALNRPTGISWTPAPTAVVPSASGVTFGHAYNKANQRIGQTATDNSWLNYPAASPGTVSYTADALNRYTAVGAVTPTYDGNSNLTSDGTFTLGYDAENRLTSASGAGNTASYSYDAQGRRKTRTVNSATTVFVTDAGNREVLEYDGASGAIQRWYAYGLGSNDVLNQMNVAAATRATFVPDIQGSVIASFDSSSGALSEIGYLPYGKSASASSPFGYTGQRIDPETGGLYYYRARMYHPAWGRFLQPDPIGYAGGANLYAYLNNDPLNNADPFGLAPGDSYPTADAAAIAALRDINPNSQRYGLEYAGRVYQTWFGFGSYSYTSPVEGTPFSSSPGNRILTPLLHSFGVNAGMYHTHPSGTDPILNENYSPTDKQVSDYEGVPSYLGTPSGQIYKYSPVPNRPSQGDISVLGNTNDSPSSSPAQSPNSSGPFSPQLKSPEGEGFSSAGPDRISSAGPDK
jgi:RHS repeat-associated protein